MKTYVTFGQCHIHTVNGKCFDKDSVAVIEAEDEAKGRALAFEYFGGKFFTTYTDEKYIVANMHFFPRGFIYAN